MQTREPPKRKPKIIKRKKGVRPGKKGRKTKITHEKVQFIRENDDRSISYLEEETDLPRNTIATIIFVNWHDCWRRDVRNCYSTKWDSLTEEMKDWLRETEPETWLGLKKKFNHHFRMHELTPMSHQTVRKYYEKLNSAKISNNR